MSTRNIYIEMDSAMFLRKSSDAASYYGFFPLSHVKKIKKSTKKRNKLLPTTASQRKLDSLGGEFFSTLKTYVAENLSSLPHPLLFYHANTVPGNQRNPSGKVTFGLHIFGTQESIAEALVIRAALAILDELGIKNKAVSVNSIGDRDSSTQFVREIHALLRKNQNELSATERQIFKQDPVNAFKYIQKRKNLSHDEIPRSMEFLSDGSRRHFREVLEYLESINVPYSINDLLIEHNDCYSETLFEVREDKGEDRDNFEDTDEQVSKIFAKGGRYDEFGKKFFRLNVPSVGIIITCREKSNLNNKSIKPIPMRKPKVCLIQLGFEAKLKSLALIELLRKSHVPLYQTLSRDKLSGQLEVAEKLNVPYTVIMGQKEALDNTVIVRNMNTRSQDIIAVDMLPAYLKKYA